MAKEIRAWILASLAALAVGIALGAAGLGGGLNNFIAGGAAFGITFLFVRNGYGLRKVTTGSDAERDAALSCVPDPDAAGLYVIRDGRGPMIGIDVTVDGRAVARLKGGRFTRIAVSPGTHIVSATFTQGALGAIPSGSIEIDLAAGSDRAVLVAPPVGLKQKTCSLVVSEVGTDVRARLGTMTLVQPD